MTAKELIERAAACKDCGKEHAYRWISGNRASWAADDGHSYRPLMDTNAVAQLRYLESGIWADPWAPKGRRPAEARA